MNKKNIRLLLLCVAIGLLLGTFQRHLLELFPAAEEKEALAAEGLPTLELPEEGVVSDDFSLRLLRAALATQEQGNICLSPAGMSGLLEQLKAISNGATREQIESLKLPEKGAPLAASPAWLNALYIDDGLDFAPGGKWTRDNVMRVPFQRDFTQALTIINNWDSDEDSGQGGHLLSGEDISADTRFVAAANVDFNENWLLPFHLAPSYERDFYNADGGASTAAMLLSTDAHTVAAAEDGSWQAAALFFKRAGREGETCCLVAIMPARGSVRDFARELTPEKLSGIRTALAKAAPRQLSVLIPALTPRNFTQNLHPLLLELGLGKLFTKGADFSGATSSPLHLDIAVARYHLQTGGQDSTTANVEGEAIRFNKPFIWFIGDLLSPSPPLFIGLEEQR